MDWSRIKDGTDGQVRIPKNWVSIHHYEAFNLLFRIENSIRVFAYCVLKARLGSRWLDANISTDDAAQGTIGSNGKRRLAQANQFKYLGYVSPCPLLYLSMGELVELMFSEAYWKYFASYFAGKKEIMKSKLDEIIVIRNAFAHFRPLREDDIDVVRQNAKHVLLGIEEYLSNLTRCDDIVPSNSSDDWYKRLSTIGSEYVSLQLEQSSNEEWIEVNLIFTPPVIKQNLYSETWLDARVIKLNTSAVLTFLPQLTENIVFLTESLTKAVKDSKFGYSKSLSFVFTKATLTKNTVVIAQNFSELVLKISTELELLTQDDLARGELLSAVEIFGYWESPKDERPGSWQISVDKLESPPSEDGPSEYWGDLGWLGAEFITKRDKYPWMPSAISGRDFWS